MAPEKDFAAPHHLYLQGGVEFETSIVLLPHVTARPHNVEGKGTFLHFEGREDPKGFRGEHKTKTWQYNIIFALSERHIAEDLLELLENQFDAADAAMVVRRMKAGGGYADDVVEVHGWVDTPQGGGISQVSFTATKVG